MKKLFVIAVLGLMGLKIFAQPPVLIAEYRFDSVPSTTIGTTKAFYKNPLVLSAASSMYTGSGIAGNATYFNGPTGGALNRARASTNWSNTFNATKHFGITLTVISGGYTLVVDHVDFYGARSSQGPGPVEVRNSTNGFASTGWIGMNPATPAMASPVWGPQSTTAGNPTTITSVDIRFYTYGTTNAGTTWRIDSVRVFGHLDGVFNLPIHLLSFTGEKVRDDVRLRWSTATEENNDYFTILRSKDGVNFEEVTRVPGSGTSESVREYEEYDRHPYAGLNYYRLLQTDYDGTTSSSETIVVVMDSGFGKLKRILSLSGQEVRGSPLEIPTGVYIFEDEFGRAKRVFIPSR